MGVSPTAQREQRFRSAEQLLWRSLGSEPAERRLPLPALGASVRVLDVGEGPPVLFVHGATTYGSSWTPLAAELDGFRCLLLDRPGCGLSDPLPRPLADLRDLEAFADSLVPQVLDALGLRDAHLVGTSFGGYVALRAAAAHPRRIRRLGIIGFPVGAPPERIPLPMRVGSLPGLGRAMASIPPTRSAVVAMLRQIGLRQAIDTGRMPPAAIDSYHSLLRDTSTMRNEVVSMRPAAMRLRHGFDDRLYLRDDLLGRIEAPTLFLWGSDDVFGGAELARAFAPRVPGARLEVLPGMGHAPWMDDAATVGTELRTFLAA